MKTYNPATDSTIPTPGKKRKRSEENGESTPGPSVPVTPSTPGAEEGLCPTIEITVESALLGTLGFYTRTLNVHTEPPFTA